MSLSPSSVLPLAIMSATLVTAPVSAQRLPGCNEASTPFMTFALNGGRSGFAAYTGSPWPEYFTILGLKALDVPGEVLMEAGGNLVHSTDEGCSWQIVTPLDPIDQFPLTLVGAPGGHAYGFSVNGPTFYNITNAGGGAVTATSYRAPTSNILGVGANPAAAQHVRLIDDDGQIHESFDGGASWTRIGTPPPAGALTYRGAFDPNDIDHVLFGAGVTGGWVTFDAGATWTSVAGLSETNGPVNLFNVVVSPIDGRLVWCMALDLDQADNGHPSGGKHIYVSTDGGRSFTPMVDNGGVIVLTNGPELTPHPTNPYKIAWTAANRFTGLDIYEYDGRAGVVRQAHRDFTKGRVVEYYPSNPRHMYVGLETF